MFKIEVVSLDDEYFTLVFRDPFLISVVEVAQIFDADALLIVASTLLDLRNQGRNRRSEIDKKVRLTDH